MGKNVRTQPLLDPAGDLGDPGRQKGIVGIELGIADEAQLRAVAEGGRAAGKQREPAPPAQPRAALCRKTQVPETAFSGCV